MLRHETHQGFNPSHIEMEELSDEKINLTLSSGDEVDVYQLPFSLTQKAGGLHYDTPMGMTNKDLTPSFPIERGTSDFDRNNLKQLPSSSAFTINEEVKRGENLSQLRASGNNPVSNFPTPKSTLVFEEKNPQEDSRRFLTAQVDLTSNGAWDDDIVLV